MLLLGKSLQEVEWRDLQALVEEAVSESQVLEYKEQLPGPLDEDKKELLRDVSALANTAGGVILYGIREARDEANKTTGVPDSICGVPRGDAGQAQLRLEQVLRHGMDPRLTQFLVQVIEEPNGGGVVVAIGVSSSLLKPHAVVFKSRLPFWRRLGASKADMTTPDLRQMFLERENWLDQVRAFRQRRVAEFLARGRTGPQQRVEPRAALLLHVLPVGRLDQWIDLTGHVQHLSKRPDRSPYWNQRTFNFDGLLLHGTVDDSVVQYEQWFRFGGVEVFGTCLEIESPMSSPGLDAVEVSLRAVEWPLRTMETMERVLLLTPPFAVCISVLGARTMPIRMNSSLKQRFLGIRHVLPQEQIDHELELPELFLSERPADHLQMASQLKLHLDAIWQAGGWPNCPIFDAEGNWTGRDINGWQGVV